MHWNQAGNTKEPGQSLKLVSRMKALVPEDSFESDVWGEQSRVQEAETSQATVGIIEGRIICSSSTEREEGTGKNHRFQNIEGG